MGSTSMPTPRQERWLPALSLLRPLALLLRRRARAPHERADPPRLDGLAAENEVLKRQAAELRERNAALLERTAAAEREREQGEVGRRRTMEVLASIPDAFLAVDPEWGLSYINPPAEALFCVRRHEVAGRSLWRSFRLAGTALERALHRAARTGEVLRFEEHYRGALYAVAVYPSAAGLSVVLTDVSQARAAEARFRAPAEATPQRVWPATPLHYRDERSLGVQSA